ncbi:metallophosphoesterase [Vibrio owensii]|uniref:metallophosphoesterase n=1 Tax=Vibrio owensii TaxID=696485 RepID=UPI003398A1F0
MKIKFGIASDSHLHNWGAFATEVDGLNSRLVEILDELLKAAKSVKEGGGKRLYHAGDLFHVRGSIAPSVLYPTIEAFQKISDMGIEVRILAGNHDLETNDSSAISNGVESLRTIKNVTVVSETQFFPDDKIVMVPWHNKPKEYLEEIAKVSEELGEELSSYDLMIHAPVDGVIDGLPSHGITAEDLELFGFNRVYSGHYHNHKEITSRVCSVGATTHQTWGDIESVAGYMLLTDLDEIVHVPSEAPEFRDYDSAVITSEDEAAEFCEGHYVRVRLGTATQSQIQKMREWLVNDCKAAGVLIQAQPKGKVAEREEGATIEAGESINKSISEWLSKQKLDVKQEDIELACDDVLREVEDVHA